MNNYDETPWWCQLLWPWFGPPWYAEIEDPDAWLAAIRRHLARVDELTDEIAGDAGRLTAARYQAQEIIRHEYGPPTPRDEGDDDECDEPAPDGERPMVVDRDHPSWAEVNAEQQERIHGPTTD